MSLLSKEPAALAGFLPALATGIMQVLAEFKVPITAGQATAIVSLIAVIAGFWVRSRVSPVEKPKAPPSDKTPPTGTAIPVSSVPPAAAFLLVCIALSQQACSGAQKPQPKGCEALDYAALSASCGDDEAECDRLISEREKECAARIEGGE
jgi:hypothetical protein